MRIRPSDRRRDPYRVLDFDPYRDHAGVRRDEVVAATVLAAVVGLWLALSPTLFDYGSGAATVSDTVAGALAVALALVRLGMLPAASWLSWLILVTGGWVFISAFWLADSGPAAWNEFLTGIALMILGAISAVNPRCRDRGGEMLVDTHFAPRGSLRRWARAART